MPWQPYAEDLRKHSRDRDPSSSPSQSVIADSENVDGVRNRRRPSYLDQFDIQTDNNENDFAKEKPRKKEKYSTGDGSSLSAEKRVKEKSSYKRLITSLQETYPDINQEEALKGILALRVENNGTLTGMTMLEIMEGVIGCIKNIKKSSENKMHVSNNDNSDDADGENSSVEGTEKRLEIDERNYDTAVNEVQDEASDEAIITYRPKRSLNDSKNNSSHSDIDHESEDSSYNPDKQKLFTKKKFSPKKTIETETISSTLIMTSKLNRKKLEKVHQSPEDIDAEFPKICRKRKFPSHFNEYALPHPEDEEDVEEKFTKKNKNDALSRKSKQKYEKNKKSAENLSSDHHIKSLNVKKNIVASLTETMNILNNSISCPIDSNSNESPIKKTTDSERRDSVICDLCGLRFDESSKKVTMTEKTRETGQTFADVLYGLFHQESLPPSLTEEYNDVDYDNGLLCTLCVSYIDQMDVFQQKLSDIKSSIINVFIQKTKKESQREMQTFMDKEDVQIPKKRGRPPKAKSDKIVTLVYQSPLKKATDLVSEKSNTASQSKYEEGAKDDNLEIAQKLSVLTGIEIKKINTETGEEKDATEEIKKSSEQIARKKRSPKKINPALHVTETDFENACDTLQDELEGVEQLNADVGLNKPEIISTKVTSRGRGRGRGRPSHSSYHPPPPPAQSRSKKSLFEQSQQRRRSGTPLMTSSLMPSRSSTPCSSTPQYIVNGIQISSNTPVSIEKTYSVPVTSEILNTSITSSSPELSIEHLKQKKAYRKLVARIQEVHPDLGVDETLQGILAVRKANRGTMTGMSMQDIISKVRESVIEQTAVESAVPPIGEEFENMVNAPLADEKVNQEPEIVNHEEQKLFEIKCQFCSRHFKSTSMIATKKVYEIHMHEHEIENRHIYESLKENSEPGEENNEKESNIKSKNQFCKTEADTLTEKEAVPLELTVSADPVRSEISYCKLCQKQFKNAKLYGIHQNSEHAAEKEFEKISSAS